MASKISRARQWNSADRSVWYVAMAMFLALVVGGLFLMSAIEPAPSTAPAPAAPTQPVKPPVPASGAARQETTASAPAQGATAAATTGKAGAAGQTGLAGAAGTGSGNTAGASGAAATPAAAAGQPAGHGVQYGAQHGAHYGVQYGARPAALLWALACCAVGGFLGFIFGIPRSLSSDTARTAVPGHNRMLETARQAAATSRNAAALAAAERERTAHEAEGIEQKLNGARADLERLRAAGGAPMESARDALAKLQDRKTTADAAARAAERTAAEADEQAKKDSEALTALGQPAQGASLHEAAQPRAPSTAVNTNLEQISDWLTKIIVGVSLVNSNEMGKAMMEAARQMAQSFGGDAKASLALAILIYFSVIGLLGGYLLTRLFLQRAFEEIAGSGGATQN